MVGQHDRDRGASAAPVADGLERHEVRCGALARDGLVVIAQVQVQQIGRASCRERV
jgi:hypothetical protein